MTKMGKFSKATQAKYAEAFGAEENNPTLYKEMKADFNKCWEEGDKDKDGLLNCEEFKCFMEKNRDCMKARFGEATMPDEEEIMGWYMTYNTITPSCDGISQMDFKCGEQIMTELMGKYQVYKCFEPLVESELFRMASYSKEC